MPSEGMNITTNSGESSRRALVALRGQLRDVLPRLARVAHGVQLALLHRPRPRSPTGSRRAAPSSRPPRPCRRAAARACRGAGRRPRRRSCAACRKSQCSTMPAISTTLRSCSSPQAPLVAGRLSAEARLEASSRSVPTPSPSWRTICASSPWAFTRSRSRRPISPSMRTSRSATGPDHALDLLRASRHLAGRPLLLGAAGVVDRWASDSPVRESTSAESAVSSSRIRSRLRRSATAATAAPASTPQISTRTISIGRPVPAARAAWTDHHPSRPGWTPRRDAARPSAA